MYPICRYIKIIVYALAFCLSAATLSNAYAEEAGADLSIITSGSASLSATVKKVADNAVQPDGRIYWDVNTSSDGWIIASQYLETSYSNVPEFWGIQMYTDNEKADANPKYTGTGNPAGLVDVNRTDATIQAAWVVTDHILTAEERNDPDKYKPVEREGSGFTNYMWHYMIDKNTTDASNTPLNEEFEDAKDYLTVWNQSGFAWNEGGKAGKPGKVYIYLAANCTIAYSGASYKTSTLTLELFHGVSPFPMYIFKNAGLTKYPNEPGATLENHYAPGGWMNYKPSNSNIQVNDKCTANPHSGPHCFKINWNGNAGLDGWEWAGIAWLEPDPEGGPWIIDNRGYDLRGITHLSFFARTDSGYRGSKIKCYLGHSNDSCGQVPPYTTNPSLGWSYVLTDEWKYFIIPLYYPPYYEYDMSKLSLGLAVIFGENGYPAGTGSGGYTIYLDDVRFLSPEPTLREYAFLSNVEDWTYTTDPANFQEPTGAYDAGRDSLKITGPGTLEPTGCFGFWYSPAIQDIETEKLYKMTFDVGTNETQRTRTPQFRLRMNSTNWQIGTVTSVFSQGDASACPNSGDDKKYEVYFTLPEGSTEDELWISFDYVNFPGHNDSPSSFVDLKNVSVKDAVNAIDVKEIARYTFPNSNTQGWNFYTNPGFQAAIGIPGNGYLGIVGPGTLEPRGCFGIWQSPKIYDDYIDDGGLYKVVFTIGTDITDREQVPQIGLMVNSGDWSTGNWQMATATTVDSAGDSSSSPVHGDGKTYEVYFTLPASATENNIELTFYYTNFYDSPTGTIRLEEVIVYQMTTDTLS